jgi:AbrB family transcriptional regulator (stage V sporulation protein T)
MTETGMIRKMDPLGRIVIPKEIRKNLKLNSGDDIEIYVEGDRLVLKKREALNAYAELAKSYCDTIYDNIHTDCFICSREDVVAGFSGQSGEISPQLFQLIGRGKIAVLKDRREILPLLREDGNFTYMSQCVVPVKRMGDIFGAVVAFSTKSTDFFTETAVTFLKHAAVLLCGQLK